jgi:hypothetical protein
MGAHGDTKSWLFRFTRRGKAREIGLGAVGEPPDGVPLAKARILAGEARAELQTMVDPIAERPAGRAAQARTEAEAIERRFKAAAIALVESKKAGWRSAMPHNGWRRWKAHAFLVIGVCRLRRSTALTR